MPTIYNRKRGGSGVSRGGGGGGSGGIPAAILFQSGLTGNNKRDRKWKGLLLGLERAGAGADWKLATVARSTAQAQATAFLNLTADGGQTGRVTVTMPSDVAVGAAGNDWTWTFNRDSSVFSVTVNANLRQIIVTSFGFTLTQLAQQVNAALTGTPAVVTGTGSLTLTGAGLDNLSRDFTGGVSQETIGATVDAASQTLTVRYAINDTQMACRDAWEGLVIDADTTLRCTEVGAWNPTARIEPIAEVAGRAFDLYYSEGTLPEDEPQRLSGSWQAGGAGLNLQLDPGNTVQIPTPAELLRQARTDSELRDVLGPWLETADVFEYDSDNEELTFRLRDSDIPAVFARLSEVIAASNPIARVGTLQWDVTPASISGRAASDFERTFRLVFETPHFNLNNLYFQIHIEGQLVHNRAQWAAVNHFDAAVSSVAAGNIAANLAAGQKHLEVEIQFYADSSSLLRLATTSRRILIVEATGGTQDDTARAAAAAAATQAAANKARINAAEIAATLVVDPHTVSNAAAIQDTYTASLNNAREDLLFTKHTDSPINRVQIIERNTGTILHDVAWQYSGDDWTFQFAISSSEATAIGDLGSAEDFEVQVRFGRGSGGSFQVLEFTNWARILLGQRDEFPVTEGRLGEVFGQINQLPEFPATGSRDNKVPKFDGNTLGWEEDAVGTTSSGQTAQQVDAAIQASIAPFADIEVLPNGLGGSDFPASIYILLDQKQHKRTITNLRLNIGGFTKTPHSSTPVSGIATASRGLVRYDLSQSDRDTLKSNNVSTTSTSMELRFTFNTGNDYNYHLVFPVNNPDIADNDLDPIKDRLEALEERSPTAVGALVFNAALAIDWDSGAMRSVTLTADTTITFSNVSAGDVLVLSVKQDGTGGREITWPSAVQWAGGTAPTLSTGGGDVDIVTLLALSATQIIGSVILDVS